ncbi:MAG: hypothetical protein DRQ37_02590 [Gammaproteobacteria bacterium]|nr:MAG: hypothetical protein DRQ37_02590 [Gammaproteobacteria bacterium]
MYDQALRLFFILCCLAASPVAAEHEADHRYQVRGYILDAKNQPVAAAPVTIRAEGKRIGGATTDSEGYYTIRLHLHDVDLGRVLEIHTPQGKAEIRVQLTPGDKSHRRIHHANLVGGKLTETLLNRGQGFVRIVIGAVAAIALIGGVVVLSRWQRTRRRRAPSAQDANRPPSKRKKKKRRKR